MVWIFASHLYLWLIVVFHLVQKLFTYASEKAEELMYMPCMKLIPAHFLVPHISLSTSLCCHKGFKQLLGWTWQDLVLNDKWPIWFIIMRLAAPHLGGSTISSKYCLTFLYKDHHLIVVIQSLIYKYNFFDNV